MTFLYTYAMVLSFSWSPLPGCSPALPPGPFFPSNFVCFLLFLTPNSPGSLPYASCPCSTFFSFSFLPSFFLFLSLLSLHSFVCMSVVSMHVCMYRGMYCVHLPVATWSWYWFQCLLWSLPLFLRQGFLLNSELGSQFTLEILCLCLPRVGMTPAGLYCGYRGSKLQLWYRASTLSKPSPQPYLPIFRTYTHRHTFKSRFCTGERKHGTCLFDLTYFT